MMRTHRNRQQGFLLITTVLILGVLAALALMLSTSSALDNALVRSQHDDNTLDYLAETGMEHAKWQLKQNTACSTYPSIAATPFGGGTYAATVTPTGNSPVSIAAVGMLADGTTRNLTLDSVTVYDRATPMTMILAPGAEGKDAYIEGESGHRDHNKGGDNELKTSSETGKEYRTLIEFDLSVLPPTAIIETAILQLELHSVGSTDVVEAYRLQRAWTEAGVTWDDYNGTNAWTTPGGDYDPTIAASFLADSAGAKTMDITNVAQSWVNGSLPNHGLILFSAPSGTGDENKYHSSDKTNESHPTLYLTYVCECGTVCTGMASGNTLILSTENQATLGGLTFDEKDLVDYDPFLDAAALLLDGAATTLETAIDAIHVLDNGHIVLSTKGTTEIGGLSFEADDLVEYDPGSDTATMYFDGSSYFADNENITSVHILNNGNLVLSAKDNAILGGVSISNRDLVEYNPVDDSANIFFDGDATTLSANITALHVLENGQLILGAESDTTLGGLAFTTADLIQYDPAADSATLYLPGNVLFADANERIMSAHVKGDHGPPVLTDLNLLLVVPNPASLSSDDLQRQTLMESWGYTVTLVDDSDSQAEYDAAAAVNDAAYVSEEVVDAQLLEKLKNVPIGVVNEDGMMYAHLGFSDAAGVQAGMTDITITDNTHEITMGFALGDLPITSYGQQMQYLQGSQSPNILGLADHPLLSNPVLALLDVGDGLQGGGSATGRRVWLPWGGDGFQFNSLNANGQSIMRRAIEWAADSESAFGPIAHWKLDDGSGTGAIDSVGGHTGTLTNGPVWSPTGKIDGALAFDGANDYVEIPHNDMLSLTTAFTISAWVRNESPSISNSYRIVGKEAVGANDSYWLAFQSQSWWVGVGGSYYSPGTTFDPDRWYHLVATFDDAADELVLYVDGIEVLNQATTASITPNTDPVVIGSNWQGKEWDGLLDDIRLYDRVIGATEIADMLAEAPSGGGGGASSTFRDEFNTGSSFAGDDGTLSWSTDWLEIGESNGAGSGDIRLFNDSAPYQLRIRDNNNGGEGVEREANLSACSNATLTFDYRRSSLDNSNDYVAVDISNDGGSNWTELDRLQGSATDAVYQSESYDISASMASYTRIRFLGSPSLGNTDTVYFDNVEIACEF